MRRLLKIFVGMLTLSGCGPGSVDLMGDQGNVAHFSELDGAIEATTSSCSEPFATSLKQVSVASYLPKMKFTAHFTSLVNAGQLSNKATTEQRCIELKNHFSGAPLKDQGNVMPNDLSLKMNFADISYDQEQQLLSGQAVELPPESATLTFTDGSLNNSAAQLGLRCPGTALVTCQVTEIGDYKRCESYDAKYSGQCTFRSDVVLYSFSDHKKGQLDIAGQLSLSNGKEAQLKFTKISWLGLY